MKFPSPGRLAAKALSLQSNGFTRSGAESLIKGNMPDGALDRLKSVNQAARNGISNGRGIVNKHLGSVKEHIGSVKEQAGAAEDLVRGKVSQVRESAGQAQALLKHGSQQAKSAARGGLSMARGLLGF